MILWFLICALTLLAISYVCLPLAQAKSSLPNIIETEKALYEARLAELQTEFDLGSIDETSLNAAKAEEARKLLKLSAQTSDTPFLIASNKIPLIVTILFIPLFSIAIYGSLGAPEVAYERQTFEVDETANLDELLVVAEKRLQLQPDDLRGWLVVAPVYVRRSEFNKAINAYQNAVRLSPDDADLRFTLGEVMVSQAEGTITEEALAVFKKTLELDSRHPSARFMMGMAAFQGGRNDEAIEVWQALIDSAEGSENWVGVVQQRIDALRAEQEGIAAPNPSREEVEGVQNLSSEQRTEMINQMVANLSEKLENDPSDKSGWARLIRSYIILGRFDDAESALNKANELFPNDENLKTFAEQARADMKRANAASEGRE